MLDIILIVIVITCHVIGLERSALFNKAHRLLFHLMTLGIVFFHLGPLLGLDRIVGGSKLFQTNQQVLASGWFFAFFSFHACLLPLFAPKQERRAARASMKLPVVGILLGMWLYHPQGYLPTPMMVSGVFLCTLFLVKKLKSFPGLFFSLLLGGTGLAFALPLRDFNFQWLLIIAYPVLFRGMSRAMVWQGTRS